MVRKARKAFWMQIVPLVVGFIVLAALIGARSYLIERQSKDNAAILASTQFERRLTGLYSLLQDAVTGQRGYLLTGEETYLVPFSDARQSLPDELETLVEMAKGQPERSAPLRALTALVTEKLTEIETVLQRYRSNDAVGAIEIVRSGTGKRLMNEIGARIDEIRRDEAARLTQRMAESAATGWMLNVGSYLTLLALIVVALGSILRSRRWVMQIIDAHEALRASNTALEREMAQKQSAEQQVRQMQKMEAIGQLTGGIAHDFNNMLAVIISAMNLMQRKIARGETDIAKFAEAAMDAAARAASLTQRLLAFSRQQPLAPQVIDANRLIAGMSDLLSRTLGETIHVETVLAGGLWRTHADQSQLENAVLNLAVNARDAMPDGGKLTIETANAHLDDRYAAEHADVPAGQYVLLAVSDTGSGMTPDVLARAFDPFFTTKAIDKGTGLGLSQVFGFVKQSGGHVKIYSEPGQGTTVKIYLPRYFGEDAARSDEARAVDLSGRPTETILVVEDDDRVRALTVAAMRDLGYTVIQAADATAALGHINRHPEIALVFTDIVMPEINGRELADRVLAIRPELKVLFTTGFTRNAVVHNGVLDHGVDFIAKPFTVDSLAAKLREVLDRDT